MNQTPRPAAKSGAMVLIVSLVLVVVVLVVAAKVISHEVHSVHIPTQQGGAVVHVHHKAAR